MLPLVVKVQYTINVCTYSLPTQQSCRGVYIVHMQYGKHYLRHQPPYIHPIMRKSYRGVYIHVTEVITWHVCKHSFRTAPKEPWFKYVNESCGIQYNGLNVTDCELL